MLAKLITTVSVLWTDGATMTLESIRTIIDRGASEKQFMPTRLACKQPEKKPVKPTDEKCESDWNEFEAGHAKMFNRYMRAIKSGDSERAAVAATKYREELREMLP